MKPLILEYTEQPTMNTLDFSLIEYDENLNLSVEKQTKKPAIEFLNMSTETFTKTYSESSDSDANQISPLMGTKTKTYTSTEASDNDNVYNSVKLLMGTKTLTESVETTDNDK